MSLRAHQLLNSAGKGLVVAMVGAFVAFAFGSTLPPAVAAGIVVAVLDALLTYFVASPSEADAQRRLRKAESTVDKMDRHLRRQSRRPYPTGATLNRIGDDYQ